MVEPKLDDSSSLIDIASLDSIAKVKAAILKKYGFEATDEYCRDLIAFVKELTSVERE